MRMEDTFSPILHRIDQAIRWRAVHPTEAIPPAYEILTKYSKPPEDLEHAANPHLQKLVSASSVKKGKSSISISTEQVMPSPVIYQDGLQSATS